LTISYEKVVLLPRIPTENRVPMAKVKRNTNSTYTHVSSPKISSVYQENIYYTHKFTKFRTKFRTKCFETGSILDAGTLANLPAGFKSRGIRIRDDDQPFQPGEFRDVDAPGGNIRDQFQILPFKEPSPTLFQLLGFVVQAGQRFASIADMQVGDGNQQAAVGTTIALLERGSRVMSAIHKRCYYAMKQEFRILAEVFADYLPPVYPYAVYGADRMVKVHGLDLGKLLTIPYEEP